MKSAGASKTVYALVTPQTEAAKNFVLGNCNAGPDAARRVLLVPASERSRAFQRDAAARIGGRLGLTLSPSDVYVLAHAAPKSTPDRALASFLRRPAGDCEARLRLCLTPTMAEMIGTAGSIVVPRGEP